MSGAKHILDIIIRYNLYRYCDTKVRVSGNKSHKKMACPARVAETGQENIETVHEPKPIQTTDILCNGRGRRAMENLYGPQTQ